MKQRTEAQVQAFHCATLPPRRYPHHVELATSTIDRWAARQYTTTRRAIEEYHAQRALHLEMEL